MLDINNHELSILKSSFKKYRFTDLDCLTQKYWEPLARIVSVTNAPLEVYEECMKSRFPYLRYLAVKYSNNQDIIKQGLDDPNEYVQFLAWRTLEIYQEVDLPESVVAKCGLIGNPTLPYSSLEKFCREVSPSHVMFRFLGANINRLPTDFTFDFLRECDWEVSYCLAEHIKYTSDITKFYLNSEELPVVCSAAQFINKGNFLSRKFSHHDNVKVRLAYLSNKEPDLGLVKELTMDGSYEVATKACQVMIKSNQDLSYKLAEQLATHSFYRISLSYE